MSARGLFVLGLFLLAWPTAARADGPWEGTWNAGPTRSQVNLTSWGGDCGQRPAGGNSPAAGRVLINQDGDQLVIRGRRRLRTDGCWSVNPAVRRVSASRREGVWSTTCRTPAGDPQAETGTYTLRAQGENTLVFTDVSRYDWQLNESHCAGTITSSQTFSRVMSAPEAEPQPERVTCTPGEPTRLAMSPAEIELQPGETVQFRVRVVDAEGCPIRQPNLRWELVRPGAASAQLRGGEFTAGETAAEAEGDFRVKVRAGTLDAEARVTVRTQDLSDLIARRAAGGLVQADDEVEVVAEGAAGVTARGEESDDSGRTWAVIVGGGVALLILMVAIVVVLRRGKPKPAPRQVVQRGDSQPPSSETSAPPLPEPSVDIPDGSARASPAPRLCPVCREQFSDPKTSFCPNDGSQLIEPAGASGHALICPACRRGFGPGTRTCPRDGEELIPYAIFVQEHKQKEVASSEARICPKCGERYGPTVTFCGKDGEELVAVN